MAAPAMTAASSRILARGMPVAEKEAGEVTGTVVIEWDSLETPKKGYTSDGFQLTLTALGGGAIGEFRYIGGIRKFMTNEL